VCVVCLSDLCVVCVFCFLFINIYLEHFPSYGNNIFCSVRVFHCLSFS